MAVHGTSVNGMGRVDAALATYGMKAEDHMHISQDFINSGGVANMATDCLVTQNGTPNMSVNVAAGTVYIPNSSFVENSTAQNRYWRAINDATINLAINANSSGNPRITSVFARRNANTPNDDATNAFDFLVVDGTPAGSPTPPATPANHERIADIAVANGASSIVTANITDRRRLAQTRANMDGWIPFPIGSYTRASTTTFTGPAGLDFTKFLSVGDKLLYTESVTGSVKYAYVTAVTTTTVTLNCGSDYSGGIAAANNPTLIYYSKSVSPVGFPDWFNYTPTYSGFSVAPSGIVARFRVIGRRVDLYQIISTPGTSNATTYSTSGPIAAAAETWGSTGFIQDNGAIINSTGHAIAIGGTTIDVYRGAYPTAWTNVGQKRAHIFVSYPI